MKAITEFSKVNDAIVVSVSTFQQVINFVPVKRCREFSY